MPLKEMREELTCPICMELFTQPRRLPCGHSYCHLCIKAVVDKKSEESGSYLNYSRTLVCPECREEINIDFVRGIEGIPTDFKLSKLVELFQFIKANGDSDSGDELKIYKSVPCGTAAEPALLRPGSVTFLPATTTASETETLTSNSALQQVPSDGRLISNFLRTPDSVLESLAAYNNSPNSFYPTPQSVGSNSDAFHQLGVEQARTDQQGHIVEGIEAELGAVGGAALPINVGRQVHLVPKYFATAAVVGLKQSINKHHTAEHDDIVGDGKRANKKDQITHHGISLSSTCLATPTNASGDFIDQDPSNEDRSVRAQSVPVDNFRLEGARVFGAQPKHLKAKRRKQRSIFFSDSSSGSSSSSGRERKARPGPTIRAGKNKRWLMTRFLRSVIFSDSSSTDDSDPDKTSGKTEELTSAGFQPGVTSSSRQHQSASTSNSHQLSTLTSSNHQPSASSSSNHQSSAHSVLQSRGSCRTHLDSDSWLGTKAGRTVKNSDYPEEQREHQLSNSLGIAQPLHNYRRELDKPHLQETGDSHLSESSFQTSLDSNTVLKEPVGHTNETSAQPENSKLITRESTFRAEHIELPSLDHLLGSDTAGVLPALYDNVNNVSACLSDNPVQSVYDNTVGPDTSVTDHHESGTRVLVHDPNFNPCHQENIETNLSRFLEARTLYDNIDDSELVLEEGVPVSPTHLGRHIQIINPLTEIEVLKTGYEHISPASYGNGTSLPNAVVVGSGQDEALSSQDRNISSSVSSQPHTDLDIVHVSQGFSELSDNVPEVSDNIEHSPHLDGVGSVPENPDHRMSYLNTQSSSMGATLATREGTSTGSNLQLIAPGEQQQNTCGRTDIADDEFEFVENYFDTSSEEACGKNLSHINLAPSCFAIGGGETSETSSISATTSIMQGKEPANGARQKNNNNVKADDSSEGDDEEEDDGSHPGTSMLQNKKKPRSRLKKFLTSLLSLSSSDDEDDNFDVRTSSSSKSSDW